MNWNFSQNFKPEGSRILPEGDFHAARVNQKLNNLKSQSYYSSIPHWPLQTLSEAWPECSFSDISKSDSAPGPSMHLVSFSVNVPLSCSSSYGGELLRKSRLNPNAKEFFPNNFCHLNGNVKFPSSRKEFVHTGGLFNSGNESNCDLNVSGCQCKFKPNFKSNDSVLSNPESNNKSSSGNNFGIDLSKSCLGNIGSVEPEFSKGNRVFHRVNENNEDQKIVCTAIPETGADLGTKIHSESLKSDSSDVMSKFSPTSKASCSVKSGSSEAFSDSSDNFLGKMINNDETHTDETSSVTDQVSSETESDDGIFFQIEVDSKDENFFREKDLSCNELKNAGSSGGNIKKFCDSGSPVEGLDTDLGSPAKNTNCFSFMLNASPSDCSEYEEDCDCSDYDNDLFDVELGDDNIQCGFNFGGALFIPSCSAKIISNPTYDPPSNIGSSNSKHEEDAIIDSNECCLIAPEVAIANKKWNEEIDKNMSRKTPVKVSFNNDINIHVADAWERAGPWEEFARDRMRFRKRIEDSEIILAPILRPEHRKKISDQC